MLIAVPILLYAAQFNITYVAIGQLVSNVIIMVILFATSAYVLKISLPELLTKMKEGLFAGAVMLVGVLTMRSVLPELSIGLSLLITITVGAVIYITVIYIIAKDQVVAMLSTVKGLRKKKSTES